MTSKTITVSAQWALEGKQPDGEDYRVLACSTGDLNRANFADALSRFKLGELNTLPQVSVSYARQGTRPGLSYSALAIHWYATEDQRYADGVSERDNQGRPTAYTSYFCLPYHRLAGAAIGYLAMYEALGAVTLALLDGPPKEVPLAVPTSRIPAADDLAVRVAPLLLTGRPVCLLGAEGTSMLERLEFIDTVMGLLPYGLRSRMTAATWTRAANRNHRFRLFFSSAPRTDEPEYVVRWGDDPNLVPVPDGDAGEYFDWLQDNIGPLARLADLTNEIGFGPKDSLQTVECVLGTRQRFWFRRRQVADASHDRAAQPPSPSARVQSDPVEQALIGCAEHVKLSNKTQLRQDIIFLGNFAQGEIGEDRRNRYRDLIERFGLLRRDFPVKGKYQEKLYNALLRMGFGAPVSYSAYCWLEKCLSIAPGDIPQPKLLEAIVEVGMMSPTLSAIVYRHLGETNEKRLNEWLRSGQVNAVELIRRLGGEWTYPQHAQIVCEVTLEYLKTASGYYDRKKVRIELYRNGFLARALQRRYPEQDQYQVHVLRQFLEAAYPQVATTPGQDLSREAVLRILAGAGAAPTPALLSAVLMFLRKPAALELAWNAYIHGSLGLSNLDAPTLARLRDRLPRIDTAIRSSQAVVPQSQHGNEPARSGGEITRRIPSGPAL